jgi:hypothetical protein
VLKATENSDVPAFIQARFDRIWRASETTTSSSPVDVGNIDLRFHLTELRSVTSSDLQLLIDIDNDGFFNDETPILGATITGGEIYQFSDVSAIVNDLRFTLGTINTNKAPLLIKLVYFNASAESERTIKLEWQIASELKDCDLTQPRTQLIYFNGCTAQKQ